MCGIGLIDLGLKAAYSESLHMIGFARPICYAIVFTGGALVLTGGVGCVAA